MSWDHQSLGAAVGGSFLKIGFDAVDLDLIAIIDSPYRQRIRFSVDKITVDVFQETHDSILRELRMPQRATLIRLMGDALIMRDSNWVLTTGKAAARTLLDGEPPVNMFASRFALEESLRDAWGRYFSCDASVRPLFRSYASVALLELASAQLKLWPDGVAKQLAAIKDRDGRLGDLIDCAIAGNDDSFDAVLQELLDNSPVRRGPTLPASNYRSRPGNAESAASR